MLDIGKGGTISQEGGGLGLRKLLGLVLGGREAVVGGGGKEYCMESKREDRTSEADYHFPPVFRPRGVVGEC